MSKSDSEQYSNSSYTERIRNSKLAGIRCKENGFKHAVDLITLRCANISINDAENSTASDEFESREERRESPRVEYYSNDACSGFSSDSEEVKTDEDLMNDKKFDPNACLFVASLVSSRSEKELQESVTAHFRQWGELINVKVLKDNSNRPYSFIQFKKVECANNALKEAHNTMVDGRHIRVEKARVNRKLYIARISNTLSEPQLKEALLEHGPLDYLHVLRNHSTGELKGACFAQYRYREDAIKAFMFIKNQGRWEVEWASTQEKMPRSYDFNSIFVGQLPPSFITRESLHNRFKDYGQVDDINLINKPSSDNAFAFIKYASQESCIKAIENEDGIFWHDRPMRVQFKESPRTLAKDKSTDNSRHSNTNTWTPHSHPRHYRTHNISPPHAYNHPTFPGSQTTGNNICFPQYPVMTQNPDGSYTQMQGFYLVTPQGPVYQQHQAIPTPQSIVAQSEDSSS